METGTPWSGGSAAPVFFKAAVARRAAGSACARATGTEAWTAGFTASMRASTACISSSGEVLRARKRRARSVAGVKQRSRSLTAGLLWVCGVLQDLARVERVPEPVADEVDGQDGQEDRRPREDGQVGGEVEIVLGVEEDAPPR